MTKLQWRDFKASLKHQEKAYVLQGRMHLKRGTYPGEVEVTKINDIPTQQFLAGMPEIPYSRTSGDSFILPRKPIAASFTQKLDGTALIFSALHLPDGEAVVLPRTRGMIIIRNTKWRALQDLVDRVVTPDLKERISTVCCQQNATLVFELWGRENPHTVQYDR
ncbi:MAG: hypothetical protein AB4290_20710, partial [Spirulina sp.]